MSRRYSSVGKHLPKHGDSAGHGGSVSQEVKQGIWIIWVGFGLGASLASMGYHWAISQTVSFLFFVYWALLNLDANQVVRSVAFLVTQVFFKDFDIAGQARVPQTGPIIFACAPHANQFLDGLVVLKAVGRKDIGFLTAAKTMRRKYVGKIAQALYSIPVERPQDLVQVGKGKVTFAGTTITALDGATFKDIEIGSTLKLTSGKYAKSQGKVSAKISEHQVEIKSGFTFQGELVDSSNEPATYTIVPVIDQSIVFDSVYDRLVTGGSVGIFPEGGSHDRTELLPLKAGVTIMALGAMAKYPGLPVTIIPVGINYFKGHRFRSRVFVDIGAPIIPDQRLVDKYIKGGLDKREACGELLEEVLAGLKTTTVQAADFKTLQFLRATRRLYRPPNERVEAKVRFGIVKALEFGYAKDKEEAKVKDLKQKVEKYRQALRLYGIPDYQVCKSSTSAALIHKKDIIAQIFHHLFYSFIYAIVAIPGGILASPMMIITRYVSHKKAAEATKASSVKVAGRDVMATWKVMVSGIMVPVMHIMYTVFCRLFFGVTPAVMYFFFFPFCSMFTILATEQLGSHLISLKMLTMALIHKKQGLELVAMRKDLQEQVRNVVKEFGWDNIMKNDSELHKYIYGSSRSYFTLAE